MINSRCTVDWDVSHVCPFRHSTNLINCLIASMPFEVAKTVLNLPLENEGFITRFNYGLIEHEFFKENDEYFIPVQVFGVKNCPHPNCDHAGGVFYPDPADAERSPG